MTDHITPEQAKLIISAVFQGIHAAWMEQPQYHNAQGMKARILRSMQEVNPDIADIDFTYDKNAAEQVVGIKILYKTPVEFVTFTLGVAGKEVK